MLGTDDHVEHRVEQFVLAPAGEIDVGLVARDQPTLAVAETDRDRRGTEGGGEGPLGRGPCLVLADHRERRHHRRDEVTRHRRITRAGEEEAPVLLITDPHHAMRTLERQHAPSPGDQRVVIVDRPFGASRLDRVGETASRAEGEHVVLRPHQELISDGELHPELGRALVVAVPRPPHRGMVDPELGHQPAERFGGRILGRGRGGDETRGEVAQQVLGFEPPTDRRVGFEAAPQLTHELGQRLEEVGEDLGVRHQADRPSVARADHAQQPRAVGDRREVAGDVIETGHPDLGARRRREDRGALLTVLHDAVVGPEVLIGRRIGTRASPVGREAEPTGTVSDPERDRPEPEQLADPTYDLVDPGLDIVAGTLDEVGCDLAEQSVGLGAERGRSFELDTGPELGEQPGEGLHGLHRAGGERYPEAVRSREDEDVLATHRRHDDEVGPVGALGEPDQVGQAPLGPMVAIEEAQDRRVVAA